MKDKKTDALKTIAEMPLPVFHIDGTDYVPFVTAKALRDAARAVLPKRDYSTF